MSEPPYLSQPDLRRLSSRRWLIPILAAMSGESGSRFGSLTRRLGISQSVLSNHLDALESFGWIVRNPGHGHPLRPEYLLSLSGRQVAAWCEQAIARQARLGLERHDLGRWSLPLLRELSEAPRRFSELERGLAPITPRALSLALKQLVNISLVARQFDEALLSLYGLTGRGRSFADGLR